MNDITITLTKDEALVLVDWLGKIEGIPALSKTPEEKALWRLEGYLEKQLVELFDPNYGMLVAAARQRLTETYSE